jgi:hypothetical protein
MDTKVENYSISDILTLFSLTEDASQFDINNVSTKMMARMKSEGKPNIAIFIGDARDKLLDYKKNIYDNAVNELQNDEENNEQFDASTKLGDWWKNEYPSQPDKSQNEKLTDRKQKVQFFSNTHQMMNREELGVNQSFPVPIIQGTINPNQINLTSRIVCIDSQYRQNILPYVNNSNSPSYNTDYTLDLSDPLNNVTSLKLYSIQIPTTWYAFDHSLGNTCLEVIDNDNNSNIIDISDGNYKIDELIHVLNTNQYDVSFSVIPYTNQTSITNNAATDITIVFYRESGICPNTCGPGSKVNQNLGWNLGFRISPDKNGIISLNIPAKKTILSNVPADTYGPKYFILVVDDYNNNHLNNGLVNIVDTSTKLNIPSYFNAKDVSCNDNQPFMVRTAPRTLTQAQLYTINEIITNQKKNTNRTNGPTTTDVLAIIPIQLVNTFRPGPYVQFGQALQANIRTYFGPVNIERLRVRLIDDKGNLVNLHDNDWSFTMVVEELYQY